MKPIWDRRKKIDGIDAKLVSLLNRRTRLAIEIGEFKRRNRLGAVSLSREREILRRVRERNSGPLDPRAMTRLFRAILAESRRAAAAHAVRGKSRR